MSGHTWPEGEDALTAQLRDQLRDELRRLQRRGRPNVSKDLRFWQVSVVVREWSQLGFTRCSVCEGFAVSTMGRLAVDGDGVLHHATCPTLPPTPGDA